MAKPKPKPPEIKKPERQFRAVKDKLGKLMIESSLDGTTWIGAISGLDPEDVKKNFDHLKANGRKIVSTPAYKVK